MAKQAKKIVRNAPRNKPLEYTTDTEIAEKYPGVMLITEEQFNNVAAFLESDKHSVELMTLYRKIGRNEFEPAAYSYQYKGFKIRVQEPVFWDSKDDACLTILPFRECKCSLDKLLVEIGLSNVSLPVKKSE